MPDARGRTGRQGRRGRGREGGAEEKHDLRFDLPCLGARTLETCAAVRLAVLALEPGKTLLLEQAACAELAKKPDFGGHD